jgi:hypothetical protein
MNLPPAIRFLVHRIPRLLLPSFCFYGALTTGENISGTKMLSEWSKVILSILIQIIFFLGRVWHQDWTRLKEARALGAQLPPRYMSDRIGGISVIRSLEHQLNYGYIGDVFEEMISLQNSSIVVFRTLFEDRFLTTEPEHIRAILDSQFENFGTLPWRMEKIFPLY